MCKRGHLGHTLRTPWEDPSVCIRQCGVCRKNNARLIVSSLSLALVLSVCEDHEDKLPTVLRYESPVAGQKGEVGGGRCVCHNWNVCELRTASYKSRTQVREAGGWTSGWGEQEGTVWRRNGKINRCWWREERRCMRGARRMGLNSGSGGELMDLDDWFQVCFQL